MLNNVLHKGINYSPCLFSAVVHFSRSELLSFPSRLLLKELYKSSENPHLVLFISTWQFILTWLLRQYIFKTGTIAFSNQHLLVPPLSDTAKKSSHSVHVNYAEYSHAAKILDSEKSSLMSRSGVQKDWQWLLCFIEQTIEILDNLRLNFLCL